MKKTPYPNRLVKDPGLHAAAEAELRRFLGLPMLRNDIRQQIFIDDLSVGVILVPGTGEPLVCQHLDEFGTDIAVIAFVEPKTKAVSLLGWCDPVMFHDAHERIERDGAASYSLPAAKFYAIAHLKKLGEAHAARRRRVTRRMGI